MKRWLIALMLSIIPAIALANWMYLPGPGYSSGGGSGGGAVYTDDFNRANGSLGASWTTVIAGPFTNAPEILDSHVRVYTVSGPGMATYNGSSSADQYAQLKMPSPTLENSGVVLRMDSSGNGYAIRAYNATILWVAKLSAGVYTQLGADISVASVVGKTLRAEISGTTISVKVDGVEVATRSDSTYSSGLIGIVLKGQPEADDFEGGEL